jgi:S1-C subfamily serine protease
VIIQTGLVVTNYHVVEKAPDNITVNDHPAQIVDLPFRFNFCNDLVALVTKTRRLRMISFNEGIKQADSVFYVGNPEDWTKTISKGIVTKIDRRGQRIYSSTLTGEGVSGSGLYDQATGALVGIIDSIDGSRGSSGCNFTICVPAQYVIALVREAQVYLRRQQNLAKPVKKAKPEEPNLSLDFDQDQEGRRYE